MPYSRRILHYSPSPADLVGEISDRAVAGAWFELRRRGGCGTGELKLNDQFADRNSIACGDWIAFEYDTGDRWYLGRIEEITAELPAGLRLRLEGMAAELNEVFPGGFGRHIADGVPPHRYAQTDLFLDDPDYSDETFDTVSEPQDVVSLLMEQYVEGKTNITIDPDRIESVLNAEQVISMKFRGEETARDILAELGTRARNASWGVDETGEFFFLQQKSTTLATYRAGVDTVSLQEWRDRGLLYNRVLLTGGYIYESCTGGGGSSSCPVGWGRDIYRWRGNYIQPASRNQYGERRIRLAVPWIRTKADSREFIREFFRVYAQPAARYLVEVRNQSSLPKPWEGRIRLEDENGNKLASQQVEVIRVEFDRAPALRIDFGPVDPALFWPDPGHNQRWELPPVVSSCYGGDLITFPLSSSSSDDPPFSSSGSSSSGFASSSDG